MSTRLWTRTDQQRYLQSDVRTMLKPRIRQNPLAIFEGTLKELRRKRHRKTVVEGDVGFVYKSNLIMLLRLEARTTNQGVRSSNLFRRTNPVG